MAEKKRKKSGKGRRQWTPDVGHGAFNAVLKFSNKDLLSESELTHVTLPAYQTLELLRVGEMESDGFITLNEFNCMAWQMAARLMENGVSEETKDIALRVKFETEEAAGALQSLGNRFNATNRLVATADELNRIREAIRWCDELLGVMPTGIALHAMRDAAQMVQDAIRNGAQAGAQAA